MAFQASRSVTLDYLEDGDEIEVEAAEDASKVEIRKGKRIKGLCGAKPPQKPRWRDAMGFGRSMIRYGDFTADTRCRGGLMCLSRRLARFATA
jgi:hypothetical protein